MSIAGVTPEFHGLFETPAFLTRLPGHEEMNRALKDVILERESNETGLANSNVGGWHSGRDFADWGGPALGSVLRAAQAIANQLTLDRKGKPANKTWEVQCWANVNRKGQANKRHSHPGCFWSGTYYVETGDIGQGSGKGGEFEFQDPRGASCALPARMSYKLPGRPAGESRALVTPLPGMMVLFPSWMPHAVRPYAGDGLRISIAFNLALTRTRG